MLLYLAGVKKLNKMKINKIQQLVKECKDIENVESFFRVNFLTDLDEVEKQLEELTLLSNTNQNPSDCEKHVCVESKVNVGYRVCVNCYALFPLLK
jgi:GTP1/Obg family GTP-binding protein